METTNTQSIKQGDLVSVTWNDACDHTDISLDELNKKGIKTWLVLRTTYGKLFKENKDVVIVIRDETEDGDCEITAIPKPWVTSIQ